MVPRPGELKPMTLYHGTDATAVDSILHSGLQPRTATGRSNWADNQTESLSDHVYLTSVFGPHFAKAAAHKNGDSDRRIALFEVDFERLDTNQMYPDEDFVEHATRPDYEFSNADLDLDIPDTIPLDPDASVVERTEVVRQHIDAVQHLWDESLERFGNCSVRGGIPPEAITRVAVAEPPRRVWENIDTSVIMHPLVVAKGRVQTNVLMGEDIDADEYFAQKFDMSVEEVRQSDSIEDGALDMMYEHEVKPFLDNREAWLEIRENPQYEGDKDVNLDVGASGD